MKDLLQKKGIEILYNYNNFYKCRYNGNIIILDMNTGTSRFYKLKINGKTLITKGDKLTCIQRILTYNS